MLRKSCQAVKQLNQSLLCLLSLSSPLLLAQELPELPEAVSNQPVLSSTSHGKTYIASFAGIGAGKTAQDIHNKAWQLTLGDSSWQKVNPVPADFGIPGRLAMTAVTLGQQFYLFGGYSVAKDGSEKTLVDSYRYSPITKNYSKLPEIPVAVDDSVALAYQNRFIYLVSGWHNDGNVNLVQVFDNFSQKWSQATPFSGQPVFGHAGAIDGDQILICDGVKVVYNAKADRSYAAEAACYLGRIDKKDAHKISWQPVAHPTGTARYRQGAAVIELAGKRYFAFIGGTTNPYNYNGIGYNQQPSEPSGEVWLFSAQDLRWQQAALTEPVMDLRNLLVIDNEIYSLGGMGKQQRLQARFIKHQIKLLPNDRP